MTCPVSIVLLTKVGCKAYESRQMPYSLHNVISLTLMNAFLHTSDGCLNVRECLQAEDGFFLEAISDRIFCAFCLHRYFCRWRTWLRPLH